MARSTFTDPGFITGAISLIISTISLGFLYKQISDIQDQLSQHDIRLETHNEHLSPLVDNDVLGLIENLMGQVQNIQQRVHLLHTGLINSTQWMQSCSEKLKTADVEMEDASRIYGFPLQQQPMQQMQQPMQQMDMNYNQSWGQPQINQSMGMNNNMGMGATRSSSNRGRRMRTRAELDSLRR